jgi:protocatechuate 3,4-dioxygenase beta subunit
MHTREGLPRFLTPFSGDGPLYPPEAIPRRWDLTNGGEANGELLILMGVVSDLKRTPVPRTLVEIWQADANGYYDHPRARGEDPLDEYWKIGRDDLDQNFQYFGSVETSPKGIFWFQTVRPRWYHVLGTDRAAHIHFKIRSSDHGVLTTELYFPGEMHDLRRVSDKIFQDHAQKEDFLFEVVGSHPEALPGVPSVDGAGYYRKDLYFL